MFDISNLKSFMADSQKFLLDNYQKQISFYCSVYSDNLIYLFLSDNYYLVYDKSIQAYSIFSAETNKPIVSSSSIDILLNFVGA